MTPATITIACFEDCLYTLNFPKVFEDIPLKNCAKLFEYLIRFYWQQKNEDTIRFLNENFPLYIAEAKENWADRSREYADGYLSTDRAALPSNIYQKKQIREEIARRKRQNETLMRAVKNAKWSYERAKKVFESYTNTKAKFNYHE